MVYLHEEFKTTNTLKKHDEKFHIKKEKDNKSRYKCDQCSATFIDKLEGPQHIIIKHRSCNECNRSFNTHIRTQNLLFHNNTQSKHTIDRELSMQTHKNRQINLTRGHIKIPHTGDTNSLDQWGK